MCHMQMCVCKSFYTVQRLSAQHSYTEHNCTQFSHQKAFGPVKTSHCSLECVLLHIAAVLMIQCVRFRGIYWQIGNYCVFVTL